MYCTEIVLYRDCFVPPSVPRTRKQKLVFFCVFMEVVMVVEVWDVYMCARVFGVVTVVVVGVCAHTPFFF